jgi:glycerate-2-kinase
MIPRWKDRRQIARSIIAASLRAADPGGALLAHWRPKPHPRRFLLAVGKASPAMMRAARTLLEGRYESAMLTTLPEQAGSRFRAARVFACDHPYPTARNVAAALAVQNWAAALGPEDELVVLLSGGASAHLTLPSPGLTVRDISRVTRLLQRAGATIHELNTVRRHCEQLKGGRFAAGLRCRVRAFILSDVLGDRLATIGSGPTAPDPTTFSDAIAVLLRHQIRSPRIMEHLELGRVGAVPETPKPGDPRLSQIVNTIIASNSNVVRAVANHLRSLGFHTRTAEGVEGDAAETARGFIREAQALPTPAAWILGGETTVNVGRSRGVGGPSQEFALAGAIELAGNDRTALLTFSTDGRDGPTDAAGGFVTGETARRIERSGVSTAAALRAHNSREALAAAGALIRTRPTGTNLNHIAVLMRYAHDGRRDSRNR